MFQLNKTTQPTDLEKTLEELFTQMALVETDSDEYAQMADQVAKLYKLKEVDSKEKLSPNTVALIAANIIGIAIIIAYEHYHPVVSKALGFVKKV